MTATLRFLTFWVLKLSKLCGWGWRSSGIWWSIVTQCRVCLGYDEAS